MLRKKLAFFKKLAFLCLFGGLLTSSASANPQVDSFPAEINPCLLKKGEKQSLVSHVKRSDGDYYLFKTSQKLAHDIFPDSLVTVDSYLGVKLDRLGCLVIIPPDTKSLTWTKFVPTEIAQQFALEDLEQEINEQGGKQAYQRFLENYPMDAGSGPWLYFPENAWAMQKLQIPLQEPHVIINSFDELDETDSWP